MTIKTGTCHFVSKAAACRYYMAQLGYGEPTEHGITRELRADIQAMIDDKSIAIGPPRYDSSTSATFVNAEGRYVIVTMEASDDHSARYKILRIRLGATKRKIMGGLTLAEAQAHCSDPRTHGTDKRGCWFDAYERE